MNKKEANLRSDKRYTLSEKQREDLKEELIKMYASRFSVSPDFKREVKRNWDLHHGKWTDLEDYFSQSAENFGIDETLLSEGSIRHYGVANQASHYLVGLMYLSPLSFIIKDESENGKAYEAEQRVQMTKQRLQQKYVQPIVSKIYQQAGVEDPSQLEAEQQQQLSQVVTQTIDKELPDRIKKALETNLSPEESIAYKILEKEVRRTDLKNKLVKAWENGIMSGYRYISIFEDRAGLKVYNENPLKVNAIYGSEVTDAENADAIVKRDNLSIAQVIKKYGSYLSISDFKKLLKGFSDEGINTPQGVHNPSGRQEKIGGRVKRIDDFFEKNKGIIQTINTDTREGQDVLLNLISKASVFSGSNSNNITETYISFTWSQRMKYVERLLPDGTTINFNVGSHYVESKEKGDILVEEFLAPLTYHGVILGDIHGDDAIIPFVEPIENQYYTDDPSLTTHNIIGGPVSVNGDAHKAEPLMSNCVNYSFRYNVLMRKIEEYEATNIGKVMLFSNTFVPDTLSPQEWLRQLVLNRFAEVDESVFNNLSMRGSVSDVIRTLDLSRDSDIGAAINLLSVLKSDIFESLYVNRAVLGQTGQYQKAYNTQSNLQASTNQLVRYTDDFRKFKERVINKLLHMALNYYSKNHEKLKTILDPYEYEYFLANYTQKFSTANFVAYALDEFTDRNKTQELRANLLSLIQGGATVKEIIDVLDADTMYELRKVSEQIELRSQQNAQQAGASQQQASEAEFKREAELLQLKSKLKVMEEQAKGEISTRLATINASMMARANDINENKVPDQKEIKKMELEHESKENALDRQNKLREVALKNSNK